MTPSLNIIPVRSMLAAGQPAPIGAEQTELKSAKLAKPAFRTWRSVWQATTLFETFAGIFVVFYLLALVALSCALLFYTFNR